MYSLAIVGNGIAAQTLLYFLKEKNFPLRNICHIAADNLATPASLNNTGLVSPMGVKKGLSPLGDILTESWSFFTKWVEQNKPLGVHKGEHHLLALKKENPNNSFEQLTRRFGPLDMISNIAEKKLKEPLPGKTIPAYFIDPSTYLSWFKDKNKEVSLIKDMVCKVERKEKGWILHTLNKKQISTHILVIACGAFSKIAADIFIKKHFVKTEIIAGSFLQFKHSFSSLDHFAITLEGSNLIYRRDHLLLGATSQGAVLAPFLGQLKEFHRQIPLHLGKHFTLPPLEKGKIISAYRHKGEKRLPFWGKMDSHLYGIHSLYKNGLSTSLLAADQLSDELKRTFKNIF